MATSTIKLYKKGSRPFSPDKLFIIEEIESFLATYDNNPVTFADYQYQRIELNKTLKVQLGQSYNNPLKTDSYIYCSIKNSDEERIAYYWIKKLEWRSESAIQLELVLDSLNTFKLGELNDYVFDKKTLIQRQHKDRITSSNNAIISKKKVIIPSYSYWDSSKSYMTQITPYFLHKFYDDNSDNYPSFTSPYPMAYFYDENDTPVKFCVCRGINIDDEGKMWVVKSLTQKELLLPEHKLVLYGQLNTTYANYFVSHLEWEEVTRCITSRLIRKIDFRSEEINPQLYGDQLMTLEDTYSNSESWYLVYDTNNDDDTVVDCYLIPENDTEVSVNLLALNGGVIRPGMLEEGTNYYIDCGVPGALPFNPTNFSLDNGNSLPSIVGLIELQRRGNEIIVNLISQGLSQDIISHTYVTSTLTYNQSGSIAYGTNSTDLSLEASYDLSTITTTWTQGETWSETATRTLNAFSNMDKTKSTLLKVICCPYCPAGFTLQSNKLEISTDFEIVTWNGVTNVLKLKDTKLTYRFSNYLQFTNTYDLSQLIYKPLNEIDYNFLDYDIRYDQLESKMLHSEFSFYKVIYDSFSLSLKNEFFNIPYSVQNSVAFRFNFYTTNTINSRFAFELPTNNYPVWCKEQDYYNYLLVQRNNEEVIYNSSYLNYIRSGFNYDVKNKEVSNTMSWLSAGASMGVTALAVAGAVATQGATLPLAIMALTGTITTVATIANAINTTAQNERSLQQKIDQLKMQTASVNGADDIDLMKRYGKNRLLLTHYEVSPEMKKLLLNLFYYYGYKDNICGIPNTHSRCSFNYLKCEPILDFIDKNITTEIRTELENSFRTGVTFIHKFNNSWDLEQQSGNLEKFIYDNNII